ncbi:MAG TPA: alpha/beta fold hydrolase [Candidatus Merdenecus merdavium]|nr:alpha/beta fold hydrolase [Candidatus Merdenecus merdavium]
MLKEEFYYKSQDGKTKIHGVRWIPEDHIKGILQISHGMVEYIQRYEGFAIFLAQQGILVTGNDHLGHGYSVTTKEDFGYFHEFEGNRILIRDIHQLRKITQDKYPNVPYFMLGHSMGSFLLRQYLCMYGKGLSGAMIMGTGQQPKIAVQCGIFLSIILSKIKGERYRSKFLRAITFDVFNKSVKGNRTSCDWISTDEAVVDAYLADEMCQFTFTLNAYYHMFTGMLYLYDKKHLEKMPKDLPIFFLSGSEDPVGGFQKGVLKAISSFVSVGMEQVQYNFYKGDRHEILNEKDRDTVYQDIYQWLSREIDKHHKAKI